MDAISLLQTAVMLFAIAAAGGLVTVGLMIGHATLAVIAFVLLCVAAF